MQLNKQFSQKSNTPSGSGVTSYSQRSFVKQNFEDVEMSREEDMTFRVEEDAEVATPVSRFQPIYRREAKPMDLRNLRGGSQ